MSSHPRFIVVFKDGVTKEQVQEYAANLDSGGGKVTHVYDTVLKGFAAHIPENHFRNLQGDNLIKYMEPDGVVTTQ